MLTNYELRAAGLKHVSGREIGARYHGGYGWVVRLDRYRHTQTGEYITIRSVGAVRSNDVFSARRTGNRYAISISINQYLNRR